MAVAGEAEVRGHADGARSGRATDARRQRCIVNGLSERDSRERIPDLTLKRRPMGRRR
jgi:hypothetical protein